MATRGDRVSTPLALAVINKHTPDGDDGPEPEDADEETLCDAPTPPWETIEPDAEDDGINDAGGEHGRPHQSETGLDPAVGLSGHAPSAPATVPQNRAKHIAQLLREAETQLGRLIRLAEELGLYDKLIMEFTRVKTALREAG